MGIITKKTFSFSYSELFIQKEHIIENLQVIYLLISSFLKLFSPALTISNMDQNLYIIYTRKIK